MALALFALTMALAQPPDSADPKPSAPTLDAIHTATDPQQRMTVAVTIGGRGPFRFLVDTGAQNTVLSTALAERLGIAPGPAHSVTGVAGSRMVPTVSLDDIRVGQHSYDSRQVPLLPGADIGADGILGIDAMTGQRLLLDPDANQLTILASGEKPPPPAADSQEIVVVARKRLGQLIVSHAEVDGIPIEMVIDTGSWVSIGNRPLQRALARQTPGGQLSLISATGQQIIADAATGGTLNFSGLTITRLAVAYADAPAFAALGLARRPALLLGLRELHSFGRVLIDFARRRVTFELPRQS